MLQTEHYLQSFDDGSDHLRLSSLCHKLGAEVSVGGFQAADGPNSLSRTRIHSYALNLQQEDVLLSILPE